MRNIIITILGALLIAASAVQTATASEHHVRKPHRAPIAASQQLRNSNNSIEGAANGPRYNDIDFDRRNAFN
jgi:hypothetical protein